MLGIDNINTAMKYITDIKSVKKMDTACIKLLSNKYYEVNKIPFPEVLDKLSYIPRVHGGKAHTFILE